MPREELQENQEEDGEAEGLRGNQGEDGGAGEQTDSEGGPSVGRDSAGLRAGIKFCDEHVPHFKAITPKDSQFHKYLTAPRRA